MSELAAVTRGLACGIDVGGTKVHILDTSGDFVHRYETGDHSDIYSVLDDYFQKLGRRPESVVVAMAGPRDDETGIIKMTNSAWASFDPHEAATRYPGTRFATVNDMVGTTAGVLQETTLELSELKSGHAVLRGSKVVIALSTGIGVGAAVWDAAANRYSFVPSEAGHIGFQPKDDIEAGYLRSLQTEFGGHVSAEQALSGKHGVERLVQYVLSRKTEAANLQAAIQHAEHRQQPLGPVLLAFAEERDNADGDAAQAILSMYGNMLGSFLRDMAVTFTASGGVYLSGGVAVGLGQYLTAKTAMAERFVRDGILHSSWLRTTRILLIDDPNVAVKGALLLAQDFVTAGTADRT